MALGFPGIPASISTDPCSAVHTVYAGANPTQCLGVIFPDKLEEIKNTKGGRRKISETVSKFVSRFLKY